MTTNLLGVRTAANRLGIGKDLLYRLIALEEFPHYRIGSRIKILETDIYKWLDKNKRGARCISDSDEIAKVKAGISNSGIH